VSAPAILIDLAVEAAGWGHPPDLEALVQRAADAAIAVAYAGVGDVAADVLLSDDETMRELNRTWRGFDKPTNVLSFPAPAIAGVPGPRHLGDVVLAYGTLEREALADDKSLADHAAHLVIHGLLHLLGYDHETAVEAEAMETLERRALARLDIADPYRDSTPLDPEGRPTESHPAP
jgi:probable rRNA maturation factor